MSGTELDSKIKIPINTYDFFGYLVPGTTAIVAIYLFEILLRSYNDTTIKITRTPLYSLFNLIKSHFINDQQWVTSAILLIVLLVLAYVVGHIISSVSSFSIDRILVYKGCGYPYEMLFKLEPVHRKITWESGPYYRGLFFWINVYLILRYLQCAKSFPKYEIVLSSLGWFILAITLLKLVTSPARKHKNKLMKIPFADAIVDLYKGLLKHIIAGPFDLLAKFWSHYLYHKPHFDDIMIESYKKCFKQKFNIDPKDADTNNYWFCACYLAEKSPVLNSLIVNWLHMYSYARNIAAAFYIAFIYGLFSIYIQDISVSLIHDRLIMALPICFFCLSFIMLARYYYLYFSYYSKFLFRAFIYLNTTAGS